MDESDFYSRSFHLYLSLSEKFIPLKKFSYFVFTASALTVIAFYLSQRPYYNWDMLPYMALTAQSNAPFDSTYALIYRTAKEKMPPHDYEAVMRRQPALAANSSAFQDALRYFRIKPIYLFSTRTLYNFGVDLLTSTWLPSIVSYVLIGCLLFVWLQRIMIPPLAAGATLLFAITPYMITTARFSSPDAMSALFTFAGLYFITESSAVLGIVLAFVSIAIRPDAVIMILPICVALYKSKKVGSTYLFTTLLLSISTALVILGGGGLLAEFLFTSSDYSQAWTLDQRLFHYGESLINGLGSLANSGVPIFLWLGLISIISLNNDTTVAESTRQFWWWLLTSTLCMFAVRYLLHPVIEDRFLLSVYLLIFIGFCKNLQTYLPSKLKAPSKT